MTENDLRDFGRILSQTYDLYGKTFSEDTLLLWFNVLKEYEFAAVSQALSKCIKSPDHGQFLPKPADVVRMMGGTSSDKALLAWEKVDRAVRTVGTYKDVVYDDAVIHKVIQDMGGWIMLGQKSESEWPFVAKEFENRYRSCAYSGKQFDYLPVMVGSINAYNDREGYKKEPIVFIGDREKAKAVLCIPSKVH